MPERNRILGSMRAKMKQNKAEMYLQAAQAQSRARERLSF